MQRAWQTERPGTSVAPMAVLTRIQLVAKLVEDDHRRVVAALGLDAATRDLLSTLRRSGPPYRLAAGELARRSLLSAGAISQRVARAERQGLVRRSRSASDGRGVSVELTPDGHELIERVLDALLEREEGLLSALSARQRDDLARLLRTLLLDLADRLG